MNANSHLEYRPARKSPTPGHLMSPFGWAAPLLVAQAESCPKLANALLGLSQSHMHLVALALALSENSQTAAISTLLGLPTSEALFSILGRPLPGAKRILAKLPPTILNRDSYRQLIALLCDHDSATALHHLAKGELTDLTIRALYELPAALRPMLVRLVPSVRRLDNLPDGLLHLVSRGAAPTFDHLVADLARHHQPSQFTARLRTLVDNLPLPDMLPPSRVGLSRRLDRPEDLRFLGKAFNNCLASLVADVNAGSCAIYFQHDDNDSPSLSRIIRHGRFGWVHESSLGPHNSNLPLNQLRLIIATFAEVGIPEFSATRTIERLMRGRACRATRGQEARERDDIEELVLEMDNAAP